MSHAFAWFNKSSQPLSRSPESANAERILRIRQNQAGCLDSDLVHAAASCSAALDSALDRELKKQIAESAFEQKQSDSKAKKGSSGAQLQEWREAFRRRAEICARFNELLHMLSLPTLPDNFRDFAFSWLALDVRGIYCVVEPPVVLAAIDDVCLTRGRHVLAKLSAASLARSRNVLGELVIMCRLVLI